MSLIKPISEPSEALKQFLRYCHIRTYPAKAIVIRPGDIGDRLFFIVQGSVSVCAQADDGRELILAYLNKHNFIGEVGVFKGSEPREVTVKTRSDCQLAEIGYERLHQLFKRELVNYATELLYMVGDQLATRLLSTSRKLRDLAFMDVEGRIARTLLDLSREPDAITHPDGMQLHITRQEIGRIAGCSREMAGRVLKELEAKGLITAHDKTIVVFGTR
ncbi:cAMP-activated global transcriptional regulator CRP [Thiolapillus sp.]|uniref:cAMP-activated global transcriptional regulator CRP n=1 Tax=Thiolapillus sp. TaxID=2017437 RepID=UPI003AF5F0E3